MKSIIKISRHGLFLAQLFSCTSGANGGSGIPSLAESLVQSEQNDPSIMKAISQSEVNDPLSAQHSPESAEKDSASLSPLPNRKENEFVPMRTILWDGAWALAAATGFGVCVTAIFKEQMYDMNRRTFMHGVLPEGAMPVVTGASSARFGAGASANLASQRVPIMPLSRCAWIAIMLATVNMAKLTLAYSELTYQEGLKNPRTARVFSKLGIGLKKIHDIWLS